MMRPLLATLVLVTSAGCPSWEVVECLDGDLCSDGSACPPDGFCPYDYGSGDGGAGAGVVNPLCPGGNIPGDYSIQFRADATALAGCTTIQGNLIVRTNVLSELDLPDLRSLGGLSVADTSSFRSLSLPSLESVSGLLVVQQNEALTGLTLPALTSVGALRFVRNDVSHRLSLPRLTWVGGGFDLRDNRRLTQLDLGRLGVVAGVLRITGTNTAFRRLDLPALQRVAILELTDNPGLIGLALPLFVGTDGDLIINSNVALPALEMPALTAVGGDLFVGGNSSLTGLALPALATLGGDLAIWSNARLPTCDAEAIRDQLRAAGWRGVATLEGNNDAGTCR